MDQYRFGYPADFLSKFPTVIGAVAFAHHMDNTSDETTAESLLRAQENAIKAQPASAPLTSRPHI